MWQNVFLAFFLQLIPAFPLHFRFSPTITLISIVFQSADEIAMVFIDFIKNTAFKESKIDEKYSIPHPLAILSVLISDVRSGNILTDFMPSATALMTYETFTPAATFFDPGSGPQIGERLR